jgi:hypothetical protein
MSSDDYKRLRAEWYGKLKDLGFQDIEQDDDKLKAWHSLRFLGYNRANVQNQQATHDYYYYANQFLHSYKFPKKIHKLIWEQHTRCIGPKRIAELLNKDKAYDTDHNEVWKIIKYYKIKFKDWMLKEIE